MVSIVIPMKNASMWVEETLESIQKQTYSDWELIIVDDYSEDNSFSLVKQFSQNDSRIQVSRNNSTGIISALNQAFSQVKGDFITRMDADDVMPSNRLAQMVDLLQNLPQKSIVTGKVSYFSDEAVSHGYLKYERWLNERVEQNDFYQQIYRECIVASPNWMGKTADFRTHNLFENLAYPEDYDLCFHWMKNDFTIYPINEVTLLWREHPLRTSRNSERYQQEAFFKLKLSWFRHFFINVTSVGIVGLGTKGKLCATDLLQNNFPFKMYDLDYKNKLSFLEKPILSPEKIDDELLLIARYPANLNDIQSFLESKGYIIGETAFWV